MNDERIPVPPVFSEVPDDLETQGKASAEQTPGGSEDTGNGLRVRDGGSDAALDDTPRDHLGNPAQDWQRRPVPWEYTSKAKYKHDLEKFMREVYEDGND